MQALTAAWDEDSPKPEVIDPRTEQPVPSEGRESNQDGEKPSGLFYDVDPNSLTPELRQMFDGMQKAFTEKNQALSEERKRLESFGDIEQVEQKVAFVDSLNDPQNLVQLHSELSEYLQQAGYTKAEADEAAASALEEHAPEAQEQEYGFDDPSVAALKKQLDELNQWKQSFEDSQEQSRIEAAIERTELSLRESRGYTDSDVGRIYQLAYAYGGDLSAAADAYDEMKQEFVGNYLNTKAEVPTSITPVSNSTLGQIPESFGSDDKAAHAYAKRLVAAMEAAGELRD